MTEHMKEFLREYRKLLLKYEVEVCVEVDDHDYHVSIEGIDFSISSFSNSCCTVVLPDNHDARDVENHLLGNGVIV